MDEGFPELSNAQAIARDAEKVFESLLSSRLWVDSKIPQERDFGLDYRVEVVSDGKLKGCEFYVQLKGMQRVEKRSNVGVSVATDTLRYWRNKLLPVLVVVVDCDARIAYFEWFDKSMKVEDAQKTQTIHVSTDNQLLDYKLLLSLEPFYGNWASEVRDANKRFFYEWLLRQSVLITGHIVHTLGTLAYAPVMQEQAAKDHRERVLSMFATVLSKFLYDLELCIANVDLTQNPIDEHLQRMLAQANAIYAEFVHRVDEVGGWGVALFNPDAAYRRLPSISFLFAEISDFLASQLLQRKAAPLDDPA